MRFLADENFPGPSVSLLKKNRIDIEWIAEISSGISDEEVIALANKGQRAILTHDSDYGELIFKSGLRPKSGVIYFRLTNFLPDDPGKILMGLLDTDIVFEQKLTVIDGNSIRERKFDG